MDNCAWSPRSVADSDLVFREATIADLGEVVALLNDDQFGVSRNPVFEAAPDQYRSTFATMQADPNNGVIVGLRDDEILGCYQLTFIRGLSHLGGERAQIESVRIKSSLRGGGLGTVMMNDALERARIRGCFMVQLTTDLRREHTKRFYERLGFVASHNGMKLHFPTGSTSAVEATS
jgi:GNAT superfamily N-acetyltransferase